MEDNFFIRSNAIEMVAIRKIRIRLLPPLFVLYIVAFVDRVNIGFAALAMNRELAITSEQFGFAAGIFFWGYFLFEIPNNLILHRVGPRVWIARILITWGAVATLTGFVQSAHQLYIARFLLGLAEAGYFPAVVLYLGYWFRQREKAGDGADPGGHSSGQPARRPTFGLHSGSCPLVRSQQLAMAAYSRGTASRNFRISRQDVVAERAG
jgi:hypothetical protein